MDRTTRVPLPDFRLLLHEVPALLLVLLPDGQFTVVDATEDWLRATRTGRDVLIGHPLFEVFPANPAAPALSGIEQLRASLERVRATKSADTLSVQRYELPRSDGSGFEARYWRASNKPVLDEAGELRYILHAAEDVTDWQLLAEAQGSERERTALLMQRTLQMEAEALQHREELAAANRELQQMVGALAEREARLQAIVETAVDAIIVIDERGLVEGFNRAAEQIFGYRAGEVLGRNVSMLMPSPYREEHDAYMERYLRTGERHIIGIGREVRGQRKDGSVFPLDLAVAEFRVGEQRRFSGLLRDISRRKEAEVRQAELLEEVKAANEELKTFAYVVSHDLKAPLRAIGSLADWISSDYADKFDDEGKEQMRLLVGRVRRMDRLIDGILQYSRVGRLKEERMPLDLNVLVGEVVDLLAPPPNIRVEVERLPTVRADRTRIQQVFQNLLGNAIRYMDKPEGRIRVGCASVDGHWKFSIQDNGRGIEARHLERIFGLFQTLQSRDKTESTGIGLSLVRKIVEMYGGRVWVESTPGEGSTFHFTLPKASAGAGKRG